MSEQDEFLAWVNSDLAVAEIALHNGDPGPRQAIWSRTEPVTVFGAWKNAIGRPEVDELFTFLGRSFSDAISHEFELVAADVVGDLAYTVGFEHTSVTVNGKPRRYLLRATQIYRREDGAWKVVHRHGDTVEDEEV